MLTKLARIMALAIVVMAAFLAWARWGTPEGIAWLVALTGWMAAYWSNES